MNGSFSYYNLNKYILKMMEEAIQQVVENVWGTYDINGSGVLEREEAMKFVRDSLT
jgi:hypothetical protein